MDKYIGKMLDGRYEIIELIGSGGMANVYKAKCHRLNRMVAVKILKSDMAENEEIRRRFRDESRAVAQLSHANIVSVYDVSSSGDTEYIVMELIDGITLKQYMERRGQMDWRESLHFIIQIMRALEHAHSRGIIHRDIKPQNIMVLRDGSVKVADFGIACLQNNAQTLTQDALGSVHYISPEQARGEHIDARSDIYSAGVVLYEMLTGRLPFEGDTAVSVAIQHLSSVPLAPSEIREDVPKGLELICMKAMCADINKRYASATAMLEDLESFRKNPDIDMEYIREELKEKENTEATRYISKKELSEAVRNKKEKEKDELAAEKQEKTGIAGTKDEKKRMAIIIGAFAGALLLIFLIFTLIFNGFGGGGDSSGHKVPDIRGMTVEEAEKLEGIKGIFTIEVVGTKENSKYNDGEIISQDPSEGTLRKNNLTIQVYVCAKVEKSYMPTVLNMSESDAKSILNNMSLGLNIQVQDKPSDTVAKGLVVATSPAAGAEIRQGNTVIIYISSGREIKPVTVPNFVGMTEEKANLEAQKLGLVVGASSSEYSDKPAGTVIRQSISATTEAKTGDNIYFTISLGPNNTMVDVPDVIGKSLNAAKSELEAAGFTVAVQWQGQEGANEIVIGCNPDGSAEKGSTITITVTSKDAQTEPDQPGHTNG
ncbi:protein kinase [Vescimonas fastidiosa]|uniref:non-specific serine/threonine protein kinase n=1 Tax=Vescimonas fastidiosa TaxID=2714353 RepID=A0A810PR15_9FIRM|nr:Stk1 family PASTA domain-containing Ser/Thr kinase [Vescimonas fastidiosa]BCK78354.1 protein kinase [Vescimonas fastidiosa]